MMDTIYTEIMRSSRSLAARSSQAGLNYWYQQGHSHYTAQPSPGVYFWLYPVFEAVRYGEIQRDTADTAGYR